MRVIINKDLCIGCGACASLCPDNFSMGDNNQAEFTQTWEDDNRIAEGTEEGIKNAANSCPVQAIMVS